MQPENKAIVHELTFSRFDRMAETYPRHPAVIYLGEKFTYGRLRALSERFAGALKDLGVGKGDRVMIYITNCIQWVIAFLGIQKSGAVIVPVSPIYTSHEIEYMVKDSGARTVICLDTNFCYVKEVMDAVGLKNVIVTNLVDLLPAWKRGLGLLFDKIPSGKVERDPRVHGFKSLLRRRTVFEPPDIDPMEDLSYLLYTGGTTGFPKGVPGNHAGMTSYVNDVTDDVAGDRLLTGSDVYIAVNPLFHIMALGLFMSVGLNRGNTTVLMPIPQVDAILASIARHGVRWLLGVPALYRMILENDRLDCYRLDSLRYCFCGGDVLPVEVYNRWEERFGIPIYQVYGSTEVGHVCYSRIDKTPKPGTIGLPLGSRECQVVDPVTLEPVASGESGELLVYSPHTLKGYWNKPEETEKTCVEIDGKVFCRMGDFVRADEDGELYYVERSADIIKHKGFRVSASEVEAVLQDHPTVIGACVVGVPDQRVGERIKAIVVLKEDARGVGGTDLMRFCADRLAKYKVPSYIEFRDMLPKSKVGKLLRREVRDEERRKMSKKKIHERKKQMEFSELVQKRRSCRAFKSTAVSEENLQAILQAGIWAPSPLNLQPFQFIAVTDPGIKGRIKEAGEAAKTAVFENGGPGWAKKYPMDFLVDAPMILVVVYDPQKGGLGNFFDQPHGALQAASACIQNMMLTAADLGLESLWFTFFDPAALKSILGVPEALDVAGAVVLGEPAMESKAPPRKPPVLHREQFSDIAE